VDDLKKLDEIRQRTGVSYGKAREALEAAGGDVVEALVYLERRGRQTSWQERIQVQGSELVEKVKALIHEGNVTRIIVKQEDRTILEIPVTIGAIGAILLPALAALGVVAALVTRCTIIVERRGTGGDRGEKVAELHLDQSEGEEKGEEE